MATVGATTYDEVRSKHRWEVPERYNIARDVCFKHPPDKLAMVWEDNTPHGFPQDTPAPGNFVSCAMKADAGRCFIR